MAQSSWHLNAEDPRAPSEAEWARMTAAERAVVRASLPSAVPLELHPPEGDAHRKPKERARDALEEFFRRIGRRIYLSSELATYYPEEPVFCPDILAVLDVEPGERASWVVSHEGKGLDLVIEVHVGGDARKDFTTNVARYARLGIREYFVLDRPNGRLLGFRQPAAAAPPTAPARYERIVPQGGELASEVLGLGLTVEGGMLRFYYGTAPLLFMDELVAKLHAMVAELVTARDEAVRRAEQEARKAEQEAHKAAQEARKAEQEARKAEKETRRADELARELAVARAEIERLRKK